MHDTGFRKSLTAGPEAVDVFVGSPILTVTAKPFHIGLDWTMPSGLQTALQNNGGIASFVIYRCESASCDCTPVGPPSGIPYATVPGNQFSFADTQVNAGDTYTYMVSYVYFDACSQLNETSPPSSSLCAQTCGSGCSSPEVLITGNQAEMGDSGYSFIQTYDLADGSFLFQFIPGGTQTDEPNGRGLAVSGSEIFYSEVPQNSWGPWGAPGNWIHVCPYGTEGSGGSDTRTIPNPDTRTDANGDSAWISALAFQYDPNQGKTELFALTGYELGAGLSQQYPRKVYELDPTTGAVVGPASGVTLTGTADGGGYATLGSDGFTVLPNGHFIVNEDDASPIYDEYGANGVLIPQSQGGIRVNLDTSEFRDYPSGTGVAVAPDGQSLYFIANVNGQNQVVIQTDLTGNNPKFYPVDGNGIENIGITVLQ